MQNVYDALNKQLDTTNTIAQIKELAFNSSQILRGQVLSFQNPVARKPIGVTMIYFINNRTKLPDDVKDNSPYFTWHENNGTIIIDDIFSGDLITWSAGTDYLVRFKIE